MRSDKEFCGFVLILLSLCYFFYVSKSSGQSLVAFTYFLDSNLGLEGNFLYEIFSVVRFFFVVIFLV